MATKIVKATDPDIIKLNGTIYRGYYFNPVTNKAYSDVMPGYGSERLYELKPTPSGKYRFRDYTYSTPEIHEVVKSQNATGYNQITSTISQQPKARKLPDNLKVRIQNKQEFDRVVEVLKKDERDWRNSQQQWNCTMIGILVESNFIFYTPYQAEFRNDQSQEMTVSQILEIMNEPAIDQPKAKQVFKSFKIKCKNWDQAEQIIEKLKAEGYQPVNPKWQAKYEYNVNGIIASPNGTYDWFSRIGMDSTFSTSYAPEITFEEYCGPNVVNWYDLKVGDIVTVDNYPKECTVTMVEPSTYLGNHVVKLQNDVKQFWRFKDTEYRLIKRASPVETQPTENKVPETVQAPSSKGWIIGNLNAKSKIEISDNPRIHTTIESAETERLRLMNAHVGETFVILEIKSYGKVETNPVTKIW